MKLFRIFILVVFAGLISCKEIPWPHLEYKNNAAINLKEITENDDYTSLGAYIFDQDTVLSAYDVKPGYNMEVVMIDSIQKKFRSSYFEDTSLNTAGLYSSIFCRKFYLYYNIEETQDIRGISSVNFYSDGSIIKGNINDTIQEYYTTFNYFSVNLNGAKQIGFYGEASDQPINAGMLFYKKMDKLYIFIINHDNNEKIKKGFLYDYLFNKHKDSIQ